MLLIRSRLLPLHTAYQDSYLGFLYNVGLYKHTLEWKPHVYQMSQRNAILYNEKRGALKVVRYELDLFLSQRFQI